MRANRRDDSSSADASGRAAIAAGLAPWTLAQLDADQDGAVGGSDMQFLIRAKAYLYYFMTYSALAAPAAGHGDAAPFGVDVQLWDADSSPKGGAVALVRAEVEYSGGGEIAVCNLGSLVLPHFVRDGQVDFDELKRVAGVLATNLDATIDSGHYPDGAAEASNLKHRPVGIGVSGLADAFALLRLPFDSPEAAKLNEEIFEAVYFGALEASCLYATIASRLRKITDVTAVSNAGCLQ